MYRVFFLCCAVLRCKLHSTRALRVNIKIIVLEDLLWTSSLSQRIEVKKVFEWFICFCCDRWLFSAKSVMAVTRFSSVLHKKFLIICILWFWSFGLVAWVCFLSKWQHKYCLFYSKLFQMQDLASQPFPLILCSLLSSSAVWYQFIQSACQA